MAFVSTSTNLAANATYTGNPRKTDNEDTVAGTVYASHAGTLYVDQSSDETNWDVSESFAVTAATGRSFSSTIIAPYFRIRYVNGATNQTTFRLFARTQSSGDS